MNRRFVDEHIALHGITRRFRCDACGWYFADVMPEDVDADVYPVTRSQVHVERTWCPCKPWDIRAVQVGMRLPEGRVVYVNRLTSIVGVADPEKQNPEAPTEGMRELPFLEVSPPQ